MKISLMTECDQPSAPCVPLIRKCVFRPWGPATPPPRWRALWWRVALGSGTDGGGSCQSERKALKRTLQSVDRVLNIEWAETALLGPTIPRGTKPASQAFASILPCSAGLIHLSFQPSFCLLCPLSFLPPSFISPCLCAPPTPLYHGSVMCTVLSHLSLSPYVPSWHISHIHLIMVAGHGVSPKRRRCMDTYVTMDPLSWAEANYIFFFCKSWIWRLKEDY